MGAEGEESGERNHPSWPETIRRLVGVYGRLALLVSVALVLGAVFLSVQWLGSGGEGTPLAIGLLLLLVLPFAGLLFLLGSGVVLLNWWRD